MNTNRNGKIARLPREIRDQLSQRIDNGQPGPKLVDWLNTLPEVQSMLAEYFAGRPINTQNTTEWRQGGYQDWVKARETRELTLQLAKDHEELDLGISTRKINDAITTIAAAEFAHTVQARLRESNNTDQHWKNRLQNPRPSLPPPPRPIPGR